MIDWAKPRVSSLSHIAVELPNASHASQDLGARATIIATLMQARSYNRLYTGQSVTLCDFAVVTIVQGVDVGPPAVCY